ncbi:MAG: hypothetical protein K9L29_12320 [Spirochaetales bacterium]|nr:hypothetical protein [Spirochaetales bacterium]
MNQADSFLHGESAEAAPGAGAGEISKYDQKIIYCRKLGHKLPFSYCRREKGGLPCPKILDCWFEQLPVRRFLEDHYSLEERERVFEPRKDRMLSIVELARRAKERVDSGDSGGAAGLPRGQGNADDSTGAARG